MVKNHNLAKSISDCAWNQFLSFIEYKAVNAGSLFEKVNPKNTSQMCSGCKEIVKKELSERTHYCSFCGLKIDRDLNASRNILEQGLNNFNSGCGIQSEDKQKLVEASSSKKSLRSKKPSHL